MSDTSQEKLLSNENNLDIRTQLKWARKSSVAAGCKGNTDVFNTEKYSSLLLCALPMSPIVGCYLTERKTGRVALSTQNITDDKILTN